MDRLECCDTGVYAGTNESILICYCFVCYPKENEVSWIENEQRGRAGESDKSRARVARNHDNYAESNRHVKIYGHTAYSFKLNLMLTTLTNSCRWFG